MHCFQCWTEAPAGAKFCAGCGAPLTGRDRNAESVDEVLAARLSTGKSGRNRSRIVWAPDHQAIARLLFRFALGISLVALLAIGINEYNQRSRGASGDAMAALERWHPTPEIHSPPQRVGLESFTVPAGGARSFPFEASTFDHQHLAGSFETDDNIMVYVIRYDQAEAFNSHQTVSAWGSKEKMRRGHLDLHLPPGRYLLVFDNRYTVPAMLPRGLQAIAPAIPILRHLPEGKEKQIQTDINLAY